jgi:hypothetical protein
VQASRLILLIEPADGANKPVCQKRDVEYIPAVDLFFTGKQIKEEGRHPPGVQGIGDLHIARA